MYGIMEKYMKRLFFFLLGSTLFSSLASALTGTGWNIGTVNYHLNPNTLFPTQSKLPTDKGVDNVIGYAVGMVPLLTTLMAIGATLMVVLGGFYMVLGGASSEQTEKWKWIIKDALVGVLIGLLAYVIIVTLWNLLDI